MSYLPGSGNISNEQLKAKYLGTGHADTSKHEWATNIHRDTLASHLGHHDHLVYLATAQNQSLGRIKLELYEKMVQPCGPPPRRKKKLQQAIAKKLKTDGVDQEDR